MHSKTRSKTKPSHTPKSAMESAIDKVDRVMFTLFMDLDRSQGRDAAIAEFLCRPGRFFTRFQYAEIDVADSCCPTLHFTHPVFDWDVVTLRASFMGADPADEMEHKIAMVAAPAAYFARCSFVKMVALATGPLMAIFETRA